MAHSKEEVLFHPEIFKTILCEEFDESQRKTRHGKRHKCHRYYCPLAHGSQELHNSSLTIEQRNECLRAVELLPSDTCCRICTPSGNNIGTLKLNPQAPPFCIEQNGTLPWPQGVPLPLMSFESPWGMPAATTDPPPFVDVPTDEVEENTDSIGWPYAGKSDGIVAETFNPWTSNTIHGSSFGDSPAFINIASDGIMTVGPKQPSKQPPANLASCLGPTVMI